MKKNILILVCLLFISYSCIEKKQQTETKGIFCMSPNSPSTQEEEWASKIKNDGDIIVYQEMYDFYSDNSRLADFLGYALIMANKYDFSQAYYDVFDILTDFSEECQYDFSYFCLDEKTQQMALSYFTQAIYKGNIYASERLLNEFDKGKPFEIKELYLDKKLLNKAEQNITCGQD